MKGIKGRTLIPVPDRERRAIEELARRMLTWGDAQRDWCTGCYREFWRRPLSAHDRCQDCCSHRPLRGWLRKSNGEAQPKALCLGCGKLGDIPRYDLEPLLDVCFRDNIEFDSRAAAPCEHCGGTVGTELHHWAPRAIFHDADDWPTGYLCTECHRLWHRAMRDARGVSLPDDRKVGSRPTWWGATSA